MSAFAPPSLAQIKAMREKVKDSENYRVIVDAKETTLDSRNAFLIWDDDHLLLHAITENAEMYTTADCPVKILSIDYNKICSIMANYS